MQTFVNRSKSCCWCCRWQWQLKLRSSVEGGSKFGDETCSAQLKPMFTNKKAQCNSLKISAQGFGKEEHWPR